MRIILFFGAIAAILFGFMMLVAAKSAIHEIEAFILFLIGAVCLSGAGIIDAMYAMQKKLLDELRPISSEADE